MRLIDKSALVAEIERRISEYEKCGIDNSAINAKIIALQSLLIYIKAFEVKEVDLDGISRQYALNNSPWDDCRDEIQDAYKAGFELGMQVSNKAQKGEEV